MLQLKRCLRITMPVVFGAFLAASGGCGGTASSPVDVEHGAQVKQARINAYGPSGVGTGNGSGSGSTPSLSPQALARQKAQGGR